MFNKKGLAKRDAQPFGLLRQMTQELDRMFDEPWGFRVPQIEAVADISVWAPKVDVLEKDNRMITRIDLPGVKKEDVAVELIDGYLTVSGERKTEVEEKKNDFYRSEREFGSFYRSVPMPEGVKAEDIKATFGDGVLEISVPLPVKAAVSPLKIEVQEPDKAAAKTAA